MSKLKKPVYEIPRASKLDENKSVNGQLACVDGSNAVPACSLGNQGASVGPGCVVGGMIDFPF